MSQDPTRRKARLRAELLQSIDARNCCLRRRRVFAVPMLFITTMVLLAMFVPTSITTTQRVPVQVSWIPTVSLDQLVEADRVSLIDEVTNIEPCLEIPASLTVVSATGAVHRLLRSEENVQRIDDAEVTELLARLAQQSS